MTSDIEKARETLRNAGYYVDNLWSIYDVQDRFECDNETAQDILHDSLTNEYIVQQIFSNITDFAMTEGLKEKEYE